MPELDDNGSTPELVFKPVYSSIVSALAYDEKNQALIVRFNKGTTYRYKGVPPDVGFNAVNAVSVGAALADTIKGKYPYEKL